METEIKEKIKLCLRKATIEELAGFCAVNFVFTCDENRRTNHDFWVEVLLEHIDNAHPSVKQDLIDRWAEDILRVCDNCNKFMTKGFYLEGYYACCKECAIENYKYRGLTESDLEEDLSHAEEDGCETYYTEWE